MLSTTCCRPLCGLRSGMALGGRRRELTPSVRMPFALGEYAITTHLFARRPAAGGRTLHSSVVHGQSWGWDDDAAPSRESSSRSDTRGRDRGGRSSFEDRGGARGGKSRGRDFGSADNWNSSAGGGFEGGGGGWDESESDAERGPARGRYEDAPRGRYEDVPRGRYESGGRGGGRGGSSYGDRGRGGKGGSRGGGNSGQWRRGDGQDRAAAQQWQREERDKGPSLRDLFRGEPVYGVAPVLAALRAGRREIFALHVMEGIEDKKRKDDRAVSAAIAAAEAVGAKVVKQKKHDLNMVTENRPHQGLVLDAEPLEFIDILDLPLPSPDPNAPPPVWLALDEVWDPQNFGAVLRSAHFLGATGVVTCSRNSAPLSPVVSKASAGAMEVMKINSVHNMPQFLERMALEGWKVVGAAAEEGAVPSTELKRDMPIVIVMGNEGYGLRTNVKRACSQLVQIGEASEGAAGAAGLEGDLGSVDSLNVSVATGILLYQLTSGR